MGQYKFVSAQPDTPPTRCTPNQTSSAFRVACGTKSWDSFVKITQARSQWALSETQQRNSSYYLTQTGSVNKIAKAVCHKGQIFCLPDDLFCLVYHQFLTEEECNRKPGKIFYRNIKLNIYSQGYSLSGEKVSFHPNNKRLDKETVAKFRPNFLTTYSILNHFNDLWHVES